MPKAKNQSCKFSFIIFERALQGWWEPSFFRIKEGTFSLVLRRVEGSSFLLLFYKKEDFILIFIFC